MKITAAYPIDWTKDFAQYRAKITQCVAKDSDCDLLGFAKYGTMERGNIGGKTCAADLEQSREGAARRSP